MERKTCCAAVVTAAVAFAGCGGSGPLSRADLAKKGEAICKQQIARFYAIARRAGSLKAGLSTALPMIVRSVDQLAALKPPTELRAEYARFISLEHARLLRIQRALAGRPLPQPTTPQGHAEDRVRDELGLPSCR